MEAQNSEKLLKTFQCCNNKFNEYVVKSIEYKFARFAMNCKVKHRNLVIFPS